MIFTLQHFTVYQGLLGSGENRLGLLVGVVVVGCLV